MRIASITPLIAAVTLLTAAPATSDEPEAPQELLPNQVEVAEGVLAGGQPSAEQLEALRAAGYRAVLNLRTEREEGPGQETAEAVGLEFERLPIDGSAGLDEANARRFAELLDAMERPLVVHCGSGNRVGALFALKAYYVDGQDAEAALETGRRAGLTGLEEAVRRQLSADASDS
ncbi:MAG: sulfur transferase domain-containing protein [Thermoanaerobaculia bacterium]|nr:sulfur transferase domain-containing protein [Thermoanaerobaculia bacterium]